MSFLNLLLCEEILLFFRCLASFWLVFLLLRRTPHNTWKSHYRQLQFSTMTLNKKSSYVLWNLWRFVSRILFMKISKTVCGIALVLPWFRIIDKTIKTFGFHNKTHLLNLSSLDVSSKGVCRIQTLSNI